MFATRLLMAACAASVVTARPLSYDAYLASGKDLICSCPVSSPCELKSASYIVYRNEYANPGAPRYITCYGPSICDLDEAFNCGEERERLLQETTTVQPATTTLPSTVVRTPTVTPTDITTNHHTISIVFTTESPTPVSTTTAPAPETTTTTLPTVVYTTTVSPTTTTVEVTSGETTDPPTTTTEPTPTTVLSTDSTTNKVSSSSSPGTTTKETTTTTLPQGPLGVGAVWEATTGQPTPRLSGTMQIAIASVTVLLVLLVLVVAVVAWKRSRRRGKGAALPEGYTNPTADRLTLDAIDAQFTGGLYADPHHQYLEPTPLYDTAVPEPVYECADQHIETVELEMGSVWNPSYGPVGDDSATYATIV